MCTQAWRPADATEAVSAEAVLLEWLAAMRGITQAGPAGLRTWAHHDPDAFRAAFSAFARIDPSLAESAAGWLLGAGVRPDDRVHWTGDPADACLAGLAAIGGTLTAEAAGATLVLGHAPLWPPAVRPPASATDRP